MKIKSIYFILSLFLMLFYCNLQVNVPQDEKKIKNLINNYFTTFDDRDFE